MQTNTPAPPHKPKLLVLELWGLGDLAMASPFLQAASKKFEVTILAKEYAHDLQKRFWPDAKVITWNSPWTAFRDKYKVWQWPWKTLWKMMQGLRGENFDFAVSARWDPRDHVFMWLTGARQRFGFPRLRSGLFLTQAKNAKPPRHRYEHWKEMGALLGLVLPEQRELSLRQIPGDRKIVIHTGASLALRVWPLDRFKKLATHLREKNLEVSIACDSSQREWWLNNGEPNVVTARNVSELIHLLDSAKVFIGNDSGPGHLAAICGTPTFTIFGPALPEMIAPIHPESQWIEGKACEFKPCKDSCRFSVPHCLHDVSEQEVAVQVDVFLQQLDRTRTLR
ncbi:MAG: hypothetical protein JWM68_5298 [Verrucomicrobiales bacterium]|nr:hypothetical protein [Verrucomicrobiales bacterium]